MTKPLSPSAQAVMDACTDAPIQINWATKLAAAALRAAADLLSREVDAPKVDGRKYAGLWHSVDYLLAIATELEAQ